MTIDEDGDAEANYTLLALTADGEYDLMMQEYGISLQQIGSFSARENRPGTGPDKINDHIPVGDLIKA